MNIDDIAALLDLNEVELTAIRAQGPGGQNVNKVSSAIHLRFNIPASSLPYDIKQRLLARKDQRVTADGVLVLKAQQSRSQENNRDDALRRLREMILSVANPPTPRKPTRPTYGSTQRRLEGKATRAQVKSLRGKVNE